MPINRQIIYKVSVFLIPLGIYASLFFLPFPKEHIKWGIRLVETGMIGLPIVVGIIYAFISGNTRWMARIIILSIIILTFVITVLQLWHTAESQSSTILGLLPWSDANGYYSDAIRLLEGGLFSSFSGRRPLFAGFLSVVLAVTGKNLQLTLIIFIALNAIAVFFMLDELRVSLGSVPTAIVFFLSYMFYRRFAPLVLTEQLGFLLGVLALAFLWRGAGNRNFTWYASGLFFLTLGLISRAGAFFIIGTLMVYGFILFFREKENLSWRRGIVLIFVIVLPFFLNNFISGQTVQPGAVSFGNFSYTLYGQAVGGKGWAQVLVDHPELKAIPEPELSTQIYSLAIKTIRENPQGLIIGSIKSITDFFSPKSIGTYGFVNIGTNSITGIIRAVFLILLGIGVITCILKRNQGGTGLMLFAFCGIFISIPFVPPTDANVMRVYAVTIPIITVLPALGLKQIWSLFQQNKMKLTYLLNPNVELVGFTFFLGALFLLGPLLIKWTAVPPQLAQMDCPSSFEPLYFRAVPGSYIQIHADDSGLTTHVPDVLLDDADHSLQSFIYQDFGNVLRIPNRPRLIIPTVNLITNETVWVVAPPEIERYSLVQACAEAVTTLYVRVLYIKSYK